MTRKKKNADKPYFGNRDTKPSRATGDAISDRNNNFNDENITANEPTVEKANDTDIGDAGVNDRKMTKYPSNRSSDA